jgi:hypothetical protein
VLPGLFGSTQPPHAADLLRVSDFARTHQGDHPGDSTAGATQLSALNPSLLQDLMRFAPGDGEGLDVVEVLAASLRHARALLLYLQMQYRVIPLTVFPAEQRMRGPLTLEQLLALRLPRLKVLRVEPAPKASPGSESRRGEVGGPLAPLLWELALRGSRSSLLPEIGGVAAYRVVLGASLQQLDLSGTMAAAIARLRLQAAPLREIGTWPGFDPERAVRMLNGLYLLASLMVSRTHPTAI